MLRRNYRTKMVNKKLLFFSLVCFVLINISFINAEIIINQPKELYSLGDDLVVSLTIDSIKTGYLDIFLNCPEGNQNIYHNVPESKTISFNRKLNLDYIGNLSGRCYIQANYADEKKDGQFFKISKLIEVNLLNPKSSVEAGNTFQLKGTAYRENNELVGQIYQSFVEVSMVEGNLSASNIVKDGMFAVNFFIPETTHAGNKHLNVKIYDLDESGNTLNSGIANAEVLVIQKLAKVGVAIDNFIVNPGENIKIIPLLYDKAGDYINGQVLIKITQDEKSLYEGFLDTGTEFNFKIEQTNAPGLIKVMGSKDSISDEKSFEVKILKNISIEIGNETLIITNTGNVEYQDTVEVKIGSQTFIEDINLNVGENIKYSLSAPNGLYDIQINDDWTNYIQNGIALTGSAISLDRIRERADSIMARYPIVWIFLCIIFALLLYVWYKKYIRNKRFGGLPMHGTKNQRYQEIKKKGGVEVIKPEVINDKIDKLFLQGDIRKAEQVLVSQGKKQPVSIIAIKVKGDVEGIALESFTKALEYGFRAGAVSYQSGDYLLLIFSPLITKTMNNEETAIKTAVDIDSYLKDHNRKFRNDKISYGIGVNLGEIINAVNGGVLQFTNVGKTVNIAKKLAEISSDEVLLSKNIHEKTPTVKTEKFASGAIEAFSVTRIVNSEQNRKFINEFLRRNTIN